MGSIIIAAAAALSGSVPQAFGQGMMPDGGASARLTRLFGMDRSFTAKAVMTVKSGSKKGLQNMEMSFATLAGKVRTEIDMASMAGSDPAAGQQMAAMGMGRMISITRPDLKKSYLVYPGLSAYCEIALADALQQPDKAPKIEKKEIGRETLDGHPCVKQQVTVTEDGGRTHSALMWEATDLNNFPIQTQMVTEDGEITTRFKEIKTDKPAAALFDPPAGYQRYGSMQEMMMGAMRKKMMMGP